MLVSTLLSTAADGFGRLPAIDPRDRNFKLRTLGRMDLVDPGTLPRSKHWMLGPILDQGRTPQCVEFAWRQFLATGPIKNYWTKPTGWLYAEAQKVDEWPGEGYAGTSVRAGVKVVQREGQITTYAWGEDLADCIIWLKTKGPLVVGTTWKTGMLMTNSGGFVRVQGNSEGGHAYVLKGCNDSIRCPDGTLGALRLANSWSTEWGQRGLAWISYSDFARLLEDWGEACTATEIKFRSSLEE